MVNRSELISRMITPDTDAFYDAGDGKKRMRSVRGYYGDTLRNDKAKEQAELPASSISEVFSYVNEFIEMLRKEALGDSCEKIVCCKNFALGRGVQALRIDNGLIVTGNAWIPSKYGQKRHDHKYDVIAEEFGLSHYWDVVWIKFTSTGHVRVVGKGTDIGGKQNEKGEDLSSVLLTKEVDQQLDESFVLIFPLTPDILNAPQVKNYQDRTGMVECGIGNYLISKGVPIIDYYSHNN